MNVFLMSLEIQSIEIRNYAHMMNGLLCAGRDLKYRRRVLHSIEIDFTLHVQYFPYTMYIRPRLIVSIQYISTLHLRHL